MRRFAQVGLLVLGGLGLLQTSLFTDEYLRLVKEGMRPLLIASGVVLIGLGVTEAWVSLRRPHEHEQQEREGAGASVVPTGTVMAGTVMAVMGTTTPVCPVSPGCSSCPC